VEKNYQHRAHSLFQDQKIGWPLLNANWHRLKDAREKRFEFDGFSIHVQYNPGRITSSAARTDKASIRNRNCFLCMKHRPEEQAHLLFGADFELLCNPFPIFREHFTIAKTSHTPQVIDPEFDNFIELSKALPDFVVFYNAAACGASAPDHMHFQAGNRGFVPIEEEIDVLKEKYGEILDSSGSSIVMALDDGLRRFLILDSEDKGWLANKFSIILQFTRELVNGEEPMLNIFVYYEDGRWQILVFPRDKHRPWQLFEEGERNILLSPASVDMGGTLITPLEKDFNKISREDIIDIFSQVSISGERFDRLKKFMQTYTE